MWSWDYARAQPDENGDRSTDADAQGNVRPWLLNSVIAVDSVGPVRTPFRPTPRPPVHTRHRHQTVTPVHITRGAAVIVVVLVVGAWTATNLRATRPVGASPTSAPRTAVPAPPPTTPPAPLAVTALTPASGTKGVPASAPIDVTFSTPLTPSSATPQLAPSWPGQWARTGPNALRFTPASPFPPGAPITVTIPAGPPGPHGANGATLPTAVTTKFTVAVGSTLRLNSSWPQPATSR